MFITPIQTPSEGVQRGFAPLQVQEVVLRFLRFFEGVALKLPQGDEIPLTPFGAYFLIKPLLNGFKGRKPFVGGYGGQRPP
jgi:hypothetical protein